MKNWCKRAALGIGALVVLLACTLKVQAAEDNTIYTGIYVEHIDLSGKTVEEAREEVQAYVDSLQDVKITLHAVDDGTITVSAAELGMRWVNSQIVEEALLVGRTGNIVERYKILKDLERENLILPIELDFDKEAIRKVVEEQCVQFNTEAVDAHLSRENGTFVIEEGKTGYVLNNEASVDTIYRTLTEQWNKQDTDIMLEAEVDEPQGSAEELALVKDLLGSYSTSFKSSGKARSANVSNGAALINGTTLYPGEEFSAYDHVSPFTEANGYYPAGSYLNGMVVDSLGGGICQVSTTLYNAVLLAELEVTERHNHSMIVTYVPRSADAAIAESAGKDFRFVNNTEHPIYIEGYTQDKQIIFNIYGVETRPANRQVRYESVTLETINPDRENIIAAASQPVGFVDVQSVHIGYKAQLWKIVTEDGQEVSREQVNSSNYKMVPRTATVGIATPDPNVLGTIQAAIATGSIDHVKNVAASLAAGQLQQANDANAAAAQQAADAAAAAAAAQPDPNAAPPGDPNAAAQPDPNAAQPAQ